MGTTDKTAVEALDTDAPGEHADNAVASALAFARRHAVPTLLDLGEGVRVARGRQSLLSIATHASAPSTTRGTCTISGSRIVRRSYSACRGSTSRSTARASASRRAICSRVSDRPSGITLPPW